jgi:hypothetical protein
LAINRVEHFGKTGNFVKNLWLTKHDSSLNL